MTAQSPEIARLMDNARVHLPGALNGALQLELFNVLDAFLKKTKFWQEEISYTLESGRVVYELSGTEDGHMIQLMSNVNSSETPVAASLMSPPTIILARAPSVVEALTATVAYTVVDPVSTDGYPVTPDGLLQRYGSGVLDGLLGRMMAQPAKPYSNQQLAIYYSRKFAGVTAQALADVRRKNIYDAQRWRFPLFAGGSQR